MVLGRECYTYLNILSEKWGKLEVADSKLEGLARRYIRLLGIPEISFQLRASYFTRFFKQLESSKAIKPGFRVLDAGCGFGAYSYYIGKKYPTARIDACDIDVKCVEMGKEISKELGLKNVNIFQKDLVELSERNKYDLIIAIEVLEHIKNDQQAIKNIYTALRTGGILYLHVPQRQLKWKHFERFRPMVEKFGPSVKRECCVARDHVRDGYSEYEIAKFLKNNNFTIKKLKNAFGIIGWLAFELNLLALMLLPLPVAALVFPTMLIILPLDTLLENKRGNSILIIAQK